jgi:hypothetical protein
MLNDTHTGAGASRPHGPGRPASRPARIQAGRKGIAPEHPWTEAQDALLKKIFGTTNLADRKQAFKTLMPKLRPHTPRAAASRAAKMGWSMPLYKPRRYWTAEEDALIEKWAHLSLTALKTRLGRQGFWRTEQAIHKRRMEIAGSQRDNRLAAGYYSTTEAGELLGMSRSTIERFCRDGTMTADREPSNSPNLPGYVYRIRAKDLREFVINYTAHIRIEKVDKFALVDLLCPRHGIKTPGHTDTVGTAGEDETVAKPLSLGAYA